MECGLERLALQPVTPNSPGLQGSPVTYCAQPPTDYVETNLPPRSLAQSSMLPNMISCGQLEQERMV